MVKEKHSDNKKGKKNLKRKEKGQKQNQKREKY